MKAYKVLFLMLAVAVLTACGSKKEDPPAPTPGYQQQAPAGYQQPTQTPGFAQTAPVGQPAVAPLGNPVQAAPVAVNTITAYALTKNELARALGRAKASYEVLRPTNVANPDGTVKMVKGIVMPDAVKPTDSNSNGLVTTQVYLPDLDTGKLVLTTVYCSYVPEINNCLQKDEAPNGIAFTTERRQ